MRGNSHVRFGAGDEETCPGNGTRRFIPTLPERAAFLFLSELCQISMAGRANPLRSSAMSASTRVRDERPLGRDR